VPTSEDIARLVGPVTETVRVRHCVAHAAEAVLHPEAMDWSSSYRARVGEREFEVVSLPGVFSHGRLDRGTALLLESLASYRFGRALDWGCGSGVVGAFLRISNPAASVELTDSNVAALESARLTMEANGLEAGTVYASDGYSDVRGRFDLIASNPPFHRGYEYTTAAFEKLAREAPSHLTKRGRVMVVVGDSSPARRILGEYFGQVRTIAKSEGYMVLESSETLPQ
jgi:16S rRNA (guanine1207-N2)-methyltransferase